MQTTLNELASDWEGSKYFDFLHVLDEVEITRGRNAKLDLLRPALASEWVREFFKYTWDYKFVYYTKMASRSRPDPVFDLPDFIWWSEVKALLDDLRNGTWGYGSHECRRNLEVVTLRSTQRQRKWLQKLLWGDLKIGVTAGTINKLAPGTVDIYKLRKAGEIPREWPNHVLLAEPKYDGWRGTIRKSGRRLEMYSSGGHVIAVYETSDRGKVSEKWGGTSHILEAGFRILGNMDGCIDGEILGNMRQTTASAARVAGADESLVFKAFDFRPLEFWQQSWPVAELDRRIILEELLAPGTHSDTIPSEDMSGDVLNGLRMRFECEDKLDIHRPYPSNMGFVNYPIHLVPQTEICDQDDGSSFVKSMFSQGIEGAIFKDPSAPCNLDREGTWFKWKEYCEQEFRLVRVDASEEYYGLEDTEGYRGLSLHHKSDLLARGVPEGEWRRVAARLVVDVDGVHVSVSGIKHKLRVDLWLDKDELESKGQWVMYLLIQISYVPTTLYLITSWMHPVSKESSVEC